MSEDTNGRQNIPHGWGDDTLSHFQALASHNEFATFTQNRDWYLALSAVAADLQKCSEHAISNILKVDDPSSLLLFMAAHNHYLGAARAATAGHCMAAYPTGRAGMESALYGWYIATHDGAGVRWHEKPQGGAQAREWGREFKFSSMAAALEKVNIDAAKWARHLHQTAIDFGAHPNKYALYSNMSHEALKDGASLLQMTYLHPWSELFVSTAKFVMEAGMISLALFGVSYPAAVHDLGLDGMGTRHATTLAAMVSAEAAGPLFSANKPKAQEDTD